MKKPTISQTEFSQAELEAITETHNDQKVVGKVSTGKQAIIWTHDGQKVVEHVLDANGNPSTWKEQ